MCRIRIRDAIVIAICSAGYAPARRQCSASSSAMERHEVFVAATALSNRPTRAFRSREKSTSALLAGERFSRRQIRSASRSGVKFSGRVGTLGDQLQKSSRHVFAFAKFSERPKPAIAVEAFEVNERRAHIDRGRCWSWIARAPVHDATVHVAFLVANNMNDAQTLKPSGPLRRDPVVEFVVRAVEGDFVLGSNESH
jgi:hypothetical protein